MLGDSELTRKQQYQMLRRSKMLLSMRRADDEVAKLLERRKEWNIAKLPVIRSNLNLFPAVKYSYSSRRPDKQEKMPEISRADIARGENQQRSTRLYPRLTSRIAREA